MAAAGPPRLPPAPPTSTLWSAVTSWWTAPGLLWLPAGRFRRAPDGARDDAGAGACGDSRAWASWRGAAAGGGEGEGAGAHSASRRLRGGRRPADETFRHSGWFLGLSVFACCVKPRLQCHPDQCCDQDRGVQLSDEGFCRGQRSRNTMYWIRVTVRYGREGFKAEVDQTGRFTCRNSRGEGRLEVDCVGNLFHEQLVTERPGHADQQVGGDAAHDPVHD